MGWFYYSSQYKRVWLPQQISSNANRKHQPEHTCDLNLIWTCLGVQRFETFTIYVHDQNIHHRASKYVVRSFIISLILYPLNEWDFILFYFMQTLFRIEAATAGINQTMEHFHIICCEEHNKCTSEEIVGTLAFWKQKHREKTSEGSQRPQCRSPLTYKSEACA